MENVIKLLQQQLTLQQQQMTQVVSVLNGISARLPPGVAAPNVPGWPATAVGAIPATFNTPPPGFGAVTSSGGGTPIAPPPQPVPGPVPSQGSVPGITPLGAPATPGAGPLLAQTSTAPPGGSGSAPLANAMVAPPSFGTYQPTPSRLPAGQGISRVAPSGAIDSDADDEVVPTSQRPGTPAGSIRGRSRTAGLTRDIRNARSRTPSTEAEDDNDGYAVNRERRETTCKSIPLKAFSLANKDQEFPIWIQQFEDAVNRGYNPHSLRRHHNYCLLWLPGSLDTDAYAIWKECKHTRNWVELKKELEDKFEDPAIRKEWRTNPRALMWDEQGESLQSFLARVKRKVNTYDADIAKTEEAKAVLYATRFMNGMPDDYINHLNLNMPSKNQKVEKALEICVRFQSFKKGENTTKSEVGASVAFQDPTMPSRVTKTEMDIIRLANRLKAVEDDKSLPKPPQDPEQARTYMAGRSPGRFRSNWQGGRQHNPRTRDRLARFDARKRGSFMRRNPDRSYDRREGDRRPASQSRPDQPAEREEGLALMSEPDSDMDDLDDTVSEFMRVEQMDQAERLEYFGALRDQANAGN